MILTYQEYKQANLAAQQAVSHAIVNPKRHANPAYGHTVELTRSKTTMPSTNPTDEVKTRTPNFLDVSHAKAVMVGANITGPASDFLRDYLAEKYPESLGDVNGRKYLKKGPVGDWVGSLYVPAFAELVRADGSKFTGDVLPPKAPPSGEKAAIASAASKQTLQQVIEKIAAMTFLTDEQKQEAIASVMAESAA